MTALVLGIEGCKILKIYFLQNIKGFGPMCLQSNLNAEY